MLIDVHQSDSMGNVYTLRQDLYVDGLTVPAGFSSDGASVPRFFWRVVFPPGDQKALRAAFVHDWIYRTHPDGWSREAADMLFLKILIEDGMPKYRAALAWLGVRLFGGPAWKAGKKWHEKHACPNFNPKEVECRMCPARPKNREANP